MSDSVAQSWRRLLGAGLLVLSLIAAALGLWSWDEPAVEARSSAREPSKATLTASSERSPEAAPAYVANQLCLDCHREQATPWQASHHGQAMAAATAASVAGDFNDSTFTHRGVTTRFFKRADKFFVNTDGPDGTLGEFEVLFTMGVAPLQQYLIGLPGGRLQALQIAWDVPRRRWFHLLPEERAPAGDVLHWTGRYQTANTMCIACHTTGFAKRHDAANDRFSSHWSEPNVSCQACHGPGERHVRWAQHRSEPAGDHAYGLTTSTDGPQVEMCAPCHSRRSDLSESALPGAARLDNFVPSLLSDGLYHADGQQLDEVFEDGSFRQSRMYQRGVGCTHCHDAHSGKPKLAGNALCLQCHNSAGNAGFLEAKGDYDTPAHHFHAAGSAAAQCVSCHMPRKDYMQIQSRPDHSLRVPRPDLSVTLGTPNACNGCHADRSPQWAAARVVAWYGAQRRQEAHYGETLAKAREHAADAGEALALLAASKNVPGIVRATALDELRNYPESGTAERVAATLDPDPEVRTAAAESLEGAPPEARAHSLLPLLRDPVRAVRIAAARSLSSLMPEAFDASQQALLARVLDEYVAVQNLSLDTPGAHLNLALVHQDRGRSEQAERHYLAALAIDPDFTPARSNLAQLQHALGRDEDSERVLVEGLKRRPDVAELLVSLGLLLAERGRLDEATQALLKAAVILPRDARLHYNLGLALQGLERHAEAERALLRSEELDPQATQAPYALAVLYHRTGRKKAALMWAAKLARLSPEDPEVQALLEGLRTAPPR